MTLPGKPVSILKINPDESFTLDEDALNTVLSSNEIKNKSIGVIRKLMNKLDSLNLRNYYFECAIFLKNSILRGSILYASDMYYNLKESEMRQIERIEEEYLRKVLQTTISQSITQLYLDMGNTQPDLRFRE